MSEVKLPKRFVSKYPHTFSKGKQHFLRGRRILPKPITGKEALPDLKPTYKKIALGILEDPQTVSFSSVQALGRLLGVNEAAIVRFSSARLIVARKCAVSGDGLNFEDLAARPGSGLELGEGSTVFIFSTISKASASAVLPSCPETAGADLVRTDCTKARISSSRGSC